MDLPETLEGWYALHQAYTLDHAALRARRAALSPARRRAADALAAIAAPADGGWSVVARLVGSPADVLFIHFRPTFDALGAVRQELARLELLDVLSPSLSFLSVTEVGLYHLAARADGGDDPAHAARIHAERESAHTRRRLYPERPGAMPYVSFYPTSKRRAAGDNWYALPLEERSRLMHAHGLTGRRHAGHVSQIITGAIGLDAWEWGVTLFTADPLALKRVVAEMRHDEASARYADFGLFYVGRVVEPAEWARTLGE